jgi:hypothetical protein
VIDRCNVNNNLFLSLESAIRDLITLINTWAYYIIYTADSEGYNIIIAWCGSVASVNIKKIESEVLIIAPSKWTESYKSLY